MTIPPLPTCNCDMYPDTHIRYLSTRDPDGTWHFCEGTIRAYGPTISPHMFPYAVATRLPTRPLGYDNPTNSTEGNAMSHARPENDPADNPTPDAPTPDNDDDNDDENDDGRTTRVSTTTTVDDSE